MHYHPTGKAETDPSEIGIYFIDDPVAETLNQPAKLVGSIWMANYEMDIPAGKANYRRTTTYTLPKRRHHGWRCAAYAPAGQIDEGDGDTSC